MSVVRVTIPFAHLRLRVTRDATGQETWGLYPGIDSPAADKPLVSGLVGGRDNLTADGLADAALSLRAFLERAASVSGADSGVAPGDVT